MLSDCELGFMAGWAKIFKIFFIYKKMSLKTNTKIVK